MRSIISVCGHWDMQCGKQCMLGDASPASENTPQQPWETLILAELHADGLERTLYWHHTCSPASKKMRGAPASRECPISSSNCLIPQGCVAGPCRSGRAATCSCGVRTGHPLQQANIPGMHHPAPRGRPSSASSCSPRQGCVTQACIVCSGAACRCAGTGKVSASDMQSNRQNMAGMHHPASGGCRGDHHTALFCWNKWAPHLGRPVTNTRRHSGASSASVSGGDVASHDLPAAR